MLLFAGSAQAALDVAWDCYLPSAQVTCPNLEAAVFSNAAYLRAVDAPDVLLTIRGAPVADGVAYTLEVKVPEGSTWSFVDRVPRGFSTDAVLLRLVGDVQKVTAQLFAVEEPAAFEDGVLTLKLRDPDAGPRNARSDDESTRWYVAPQLNFNGERFGVLAVFVSGNLELNWSHPDWRVRGFSWGSYRLIIADPVDGTEDPNDLRYENVDYGSDATVVRAFGGFSLAANLYALVEPRSNFALRAGSSVGAEWVLVPFLKTDEGNFGVQYVFGAERQQYVFKTVLGVDGLDYLRHRARLFGAWHFSRVDLEGSTTFQGHVTDVRFSSITAYAGATWRIIDDLSVSFNGEVSFRNALLNEPADLSLLHPLEQFYGGGAYGDVTYWSWVGLTYTFGNSLLARQDQRWR